MPRTATSKGDAPETGPDRRRQILDRSTDLFRDQGYDATGIREIAVAAGMQTSTLYHYFANKQAILFAVISEINDDANAVVLPILRGPGAPSDRLARLVAAHLAIIDPGSMQTMNFGRVFRRVLSDEQAGAVAAQHNQYLHALRDLLDEGIAAGEFHIDDVDITTRAILDMMNGQREWLQAGGRLSLAEVAHLYTTMALRLCGMTGPAAGGG